MNIVIRTDASIEIGTGHVMRCLTLAKQLKRHGAEVTFVCCEFEGNSISYLQGEGIDVAVLPSIKDSFQWQLDAEETIGVIKEMDIEVDLVIVDHYGLDSKWENRLRCFTKKIMVIDDLADRPHDCDLLLDQNYYLNMNERYEKFVPAHCIQMIGPNYVLFRDEFLQVADKQKERTGEINNILVFFGGTDPTGETIKTLDAIDALNIHEVKIDVVVGAANPKCYEIEKICNEMSNVNFYCQISNMAELMWQADLAIGAGGSTTWERCLVGLPSLTVVLAENQFELTTTIANQGATIYLGESSEVTKETFQEAIIKLIQNPNALWKMNGKCKEIIDLRIVRKAPVTKSIMELLL